MALSAEVFLAISILVCNMRSSNAFQTFRKLTSWNIDNDTGIMENQNILRYNIKSWQNFNRNFKHLSWWWKYAA